MAKRVLIIKTGYAGVLDEDSDSRKVSLGDVLRTTVLLHLYKNDYVTWLTDEYAFPLLKGDSFINSFINRLLPCDFTTAFQLESEEFDTIIERHGFRFDRRTGKTKACDKAFEILAVSYDPNLRKKNNVPFQKLLFEALWTKWNKEEYILGYKPKTGERYDVALNTQVGEKWPTKAWSVENWDNVEKMLKEAGFKVTRQDKQGPEVLKNPYGYMDWFNSYKLIVTNDGLGLHLGFALKKRVLGLFGPSPHQEVYFYERGKAILPNNSHSCLPCFQPKYTNDSFCMNLINPEMVSNEIKNWL